MGAEHQEIFFGKASAAGHFFVVDSPMAIKTVSDDGESEFGEMCANLVFAAGDEFGFD